MTFALLDFLWSTASNETIHNIKLKSKHDIYGNLNDSDENPTWL